MHLKVKTNLKKGVVFVEFAVAVIVVLLCLLLLVHFAFKFLALSFAYDLATEILNVVKQTSLQQTGGSGNIVYRFQPAQGSPDDRVCACDGTDTDVICKKFCNLKKVNSFVTALTNLKTVVINTAPLSVGCGQNNQQACISLQTATVSVAFSSEFDVLSFLRSSDLNNFAVTLKGIL